MLRVAIELVPHGVEEAKQTLGTLVIANDLTGTTKRGNYQAFFLDKNGHRYHRNYAVKGFPRQTKSAWNLLFQVLKERFK